MFKKYVLYRLEKYVKKYFKKYFKKYPNVKLVAVVGSAGKTTTKTAVATMLATKYQVQMAEGNMNDLLPVPLGILGVDYPKPDDLHKISTWRNVFKACRHRLDRTEVQVIVQELGTDNIGEIAHFAKYLSPDITIITSILPEHMENFGTLDAVADEEFALNSKSKVVLANVDDIPEKYLAKIATENALLYGLNEKADYWFLQESGDPLSGYSGKIALKGEKMSAKMNLVGAHNLRAGVAAAAVGHRLGMNGQEIAAGLKVLKQVNGRMNVLKGLRNSIVIDDTYNSSPGAVMAALRTLYEIPAEQTIAVLGQMNELGNYAEEGHKQVAEYLDGRYLEWVITVGDLANKYIAPAARAKGISTKEFSNAIEAGVFVGTITNLDVKTIILVKGSQDGVFLEEAVKLITDKSEHKKLARQDPYWITKKEYLFENNSIISYPDK